MSPNTQKIYYLHAGHVISQVDGQQHFITARRLAELYKLQKCQAHLRFVESLDQMRGHVCDSRCVHLYPKSDGNYALNED